MAFSFPSIGERFFSPPSFSELLERNFPETIAFGKSIYHHDLGRENMEAVNRFMSVLLITSTVAAAFFNTLLALFSASLAVCTYLSACTLQQDGAQIETLTRIANTNDEVTLRARCKELEAKIRELEETLNETLANLLAAENRDQERNSEYVALRLQLNEAVQARKDVEALLQEFENKLKLGIANLEAEAITT